MKNSKNVKYQRQILFLLAMVMVNLHSVYCQASSLHFEHISLESGLSQSSARCMIQDRFGFLWIGTQDGLNRYDGYEFKVFKYDPLDSNSLTGNFITYLFEDHEGLLWIGTVGGVTVYDPIANIFTRYFPDPKNTHGLQGKAVTGICEDAQGAIWIGTYLGGLNKFDKTSRTFRTYVNDPNDPKSISSNVITDIAKDRDGNIWVGTFGSGLNKFSPASGIYERYVNDPRNAHSISSNIITSMMFDDENNLFIGVHNGLNVLDPTTKTFTYYKNDPKNIHSLSSDPIQKIYKDKKGAIWIGTYDAGLNYFDSKHNRFDRYQKNENDLSSLSANGISSIFVDRNNILWVGTGTSGLNKCSLQPHMFTVMNSQRSNPRSLSHACIRSIFEDSKGTLWIGTDNGLNSREKGAENIEHYFYDPGNPKSISNNMIWTIAEDRKGYLWIGTQSGLNRFDPISKSFTRFLNDQKDKKSIPYNLINHIYIDDTDILWLGTGGGGLIQYDPRRNTFKQLFHQDQDSTSISDNTVYDICKGKNGQLWICTFTGLNSFDPATETFARPAQMKLSSKVHETTSIFSIHEDESGVVWLGTMGEGLIRYDAAQHQVKSYTEKDGLANNVVYCIVADSKSDLWLSTNKGLSRFNKISGTFKNYDITDGLPSNEFNSGAQLRMRDGRILFGGINGIAFFHPDSLYENTSVPNTVITQFKVFDEAPYKDRVFYGGEEIHLSYYDNYFSFEFAGLEFTEPSKNQYAYKLEGLDNEWIYSGKRRYVGYTHLEPREFTFHVKASNNAGIWNDKELAIKIFISPPFWETWWFRSLVLLTIVAVMFALYRYRISKLLELERLRLRIATDLHDEIGSYLGSIALESEITQRKLQISDEVKQRLGKIAGLSRRTAEAMRDIVWVINPEHDSMETLGVKMKEVAVQMLTGVPHTITITADSPKGDLDLDFKRNFYLVYKEALHNILKHAHATHVDIDIEQQKKRMRLKIVDNGLGFDEQKVMHGNGLKNIRTRAAKMGANLTLSSEPGRGTTIELTTNIP